MRNGSKSGGRILGLDYGDRTIGAAVSSPVGGMALGVETIRRADEKSLKQSMNRLAELIEEYHISELVLGYPKNMDNTEGERCRKTTAFKERLENRFKLPVHLWDERLSTQGALRTISASGKTAVDEMAAVFILQGYMDHIAKAERVMLRMTDFEDLELDAANAAITMVDDEGNELHYQVLSTKKDGTDVYMLAEEVSESDDEEAVSEVLLFKCKDSGTKPEPDELVFEMLDEDSADFDKALGMFKEVFDELGVEY